MSQDDFQNSHSLYISAKRGRSLIDEETRAIENRIKMIKFEESRALKRIQETRERISEVYKTRTRYVEDKHIRNISLEKASKEFLDIKETIKANKNFQQEKLEYTKNEILNIKQNIGKRVRGWKEFIKRNRQQQIIDERRNNRKIKEMVQMGSKQGAVRMKLLSDIKEQRAKARYGKKVESENLRRVELEEKLNNMGKEEQMLMQRVANIHEMQKQAVEELEKVYI